MTLHPVDIHVGKRLRLRRKMMGMSQEELGSAVGVTFQQIQKYERGTNRMGSSRLFEISNVLHTSISYFFDGFVDESQFGFAEPDSAEKLDDIEQQEMESKETLSLLQAYYRINDPNVRNKVLALIKSLRTKE